MDRAVALAFESGGDPTDCARTLAVLRRAGVRATIFLDGRWAEANPHLVRAMVVDGHELGNHAYSHPDLTTLSAEEIAAELERTEALAGRLAGRTTRPWFRPPFQRLDDRVRAVAAQQGYRCLSRDALDGAHYPGPSTPQAILERTVERAAPGAVLTYHLQRRATAQALPEIIAHLRTAGLRPGTVSALPERPPERSPLHPDFSNLQVETGFLRMHQTGVPPQMINLLTLGADAAVRSGAARSVGRAACGEMRLLVTGSREPLLLPPAPGTQHLLCLAGAGTLRATEGDNLVVTALIQPGDMVEIRQGWAVSVEPEGRRVILLLVG